MKALAALITISSFAHLGLCDGPTAVAAVYPPPYLPNKCYGSRQVDIPGTQMFAAVGLALWDNGAACGRWYELRCLSAQGAGSKCIGPHIKVKIIEGKVGSRSPTFSLSQTAGRAFYTGTGLVNIEYMEVKGQGQ
uniref:Plant natriuretic peptide-like 3 n=1 Tax=Venturia pyrina TaxID=415593 RepID=A0A513ZS88_9PEZI|nr:plant natriuretic peptide-like 3 [Venturia pyrina]